MRISTTAFSLGPLLLALLLAGCTTQDAANSGTAHPSGLGSAEAVVESEESGFRVQKSASKEESQEMRDKVEKATAPTTAAEAQVDAAINALATTLRAELLGAMKEGGPQKGMEVCSKKAQALGAQVEEESGVSVGRSSLRLRNPKNAPRPWVKRWLEETGERKVAGLEQKTWREDGHIRALRPIPVEAPCLACHGPRDSLSPEVTRLLDENYPQDQALGYAAGDLRGVFWAEVELGE